MTSSASLIDAFNRMAGELAASRRRLERSSIELERKHGEVEGRRRYVETVLDRIATGVISVDNDGRIRTWNSAASRLLGMDSRVDGLPVPAVFGAPELEPLARLIDRSRTPDKTNVRRKWPSRATAGNCTCRDDHAAQTGRRARPTASSWCSTMSRR